MAVEILTMDQGSEEWFAARLGLPTASEFSTIMAQGKDGGASVTRKTYMYKLAGEILTGQPATSYSNGYMERGKDMEAEARALYALSTGIDPEIVGFIRNGNKGCSPDSLIGTNGGLEIKTAEPHIQIDRLLRDRLPPEHVAQVQGSMWVTERETWTFVSYWPGLPMLKVRVDRDEEYIKGMASSVAAFSEELDSLVQAIRSYGKFK